MKADGDWIEREVKWVVGVSGAGRGKEKGGRPTTARGGGFECFSCSGTVVGIGRSCSFFLAICDIVVTSALLLRSVCFVSSRFISFYLVSSRLRVPRFVLPCSPALAAVVSV